MWFPASCRADRAFGGARPGRGAAATLLAASMYVVAGAASAHGPLTLAGTQLEPVGWSELAGWAADDHLAAFAVYRESCEALHKLRRSDDQGRIAAALSNVCRRAMDLRPRDADAARRFFEQNFQPVRIARLGEAAGLLTGYFEPIVAGSRFPNPEFLLPPPARMGRRPQGRPGRPPPRERASACCGRIAA